MVAIRLVYSHISIRWYKFRPYYYYGCRLQRESHLQELLSVSWPNARMGIKDPAVLRRIQDDSTEMEMMAALQTLSSNSMQAGLRAARNICCSPPLPAVSPPAFPGSLLSMTSPLTRLFRSPTVGSTLNIDIAIFAFRLQALDISPTSFRFCALIQFTSERK